MRYFFGRDFALGFVARMIAGGKMMGVRRRISIARQTAPRSRHNPNVPAASAVGRSASIAATARRIASALDTAGGAEGFTTDQRRAPETQRLKGRRTRPSTAGGSRTREDWPDLTRPGRACGFAAAPTRSAAVGVSTKPSRRERGMRGPFSAICGAARWATGCSRSARSDGFQRQLLGGVAAIPQPHSGLHRQSITSRRTRSRAGRRRSRRGARSCLAGGRSAAQ